MIEHNGELVEAEGHLIDSQLLSAIFEEFCREFAKEMNRLRMEQRSGLKDAKRELERVKREIQKVIAAIKAGFALAELKGEWDALQSRKEALLVQLAQADEPPWHPSMARPLPEQGRRTRRRAPARGHAPGSVRDAPWPD